MTQATENTTTDATAVVTEEKVVNKAELARAIFTAMYPASPRKDIIVRFKAEAGLSDAGAATYYQNFVKKAKEAVTTEVSTTEAVAEGVEVVEASRNGPLGDEGVDGIATQATEGYDGLLSQEAMAE